MDAPQLQQPPKADIEIVYTQELGNRIAESQENIKKTNATLETTQQKQDELKTLFTASEAMIPKFEANVDSLLGIRKDVQKLREEVRITNQAGVEFGQISLAHSERLKKLEAELTQAQTNKKIIAKHAGQLKSADERIQTLSKVSDDFISRLATEQKRGEKIEKDFKNLKERFDSLVKNSNAQDNAPNEQISELKQTLEMLQGQFGQDKNARDATITNLLAQFKELKQLATSTEQGQTDPATAIQNLKDENKFWHRIYLCLTGGSTLLAAVLIWLHVHKA